MSRSDRIWLAVALLCLAVIGTLWGGMAIESGKALRQRVRALERHNEPVQTCNENEPEALP